ncbi:thiamine diphosphate-binding protein [Elsinoe ampelina]|uniref:Pyruvate decarboxylase n=1 Tax=Elsinoe ampelina TaxID=302913 RepID=A0A6A6GI09_9PEZI|nr:thiamine diphosphate-binding protein [Elsinoe ampelina]
MAKDIALADYLFARLRQIGIDSLFGVPGDYNLTLLDHVEPSGLHWVGNANELNAGYAADGYAKIKGCGALVTTFGVGELSAVNAIAGAYAERAAVVHIVGSPPRSTQDARLLVHHTFNDGEYGRFAKMYEAVTVANVSIRDARTATSQIDVALRECLVHSRPVYIDIPVDMVDSKVDASSLDAAITIPELVATASQQTVLEEILQKIQAANSPAIIVDGEVRSLRIVEQVEEVVRATGWPTWTTAFGKSLVNETLPNFNGIYQGRFDRKEVQDAFQSSDLILTFGPHYSSTNTYAFSSIPDSATTISFSDMITVHNKMYRDVSPRLLLAALLPALSSISLPKHSSPSLRPSPVSSPESGSLSQLALWSAINHMLKGGDIILGETGTAGHGVRHFQLPEHCRMFLPVTWLSIGYMLPASLGAALAQRDLGKSDKSHVGDRTILFIGDGSFQMTAQELGTIIREDLNMIVFLLNNDGYTIERCIHGLKEGYNDVSRWRYLLAPVMMGAKEGTYTKRAGTWEELRDVLGDEKLTGGSGLRMVELMLASEDAPSGPLWHMLKEQQRIEVEKSKK